MLFLEIVEKKTNYRPELEEEKYIS